MSNRNKARKPIPEKNELLAYLKDHTKQQTCEHYKINDRTLNRWIVYHKLEDYYVRVPQPAPPEKELKEYLENHTILDAIEKYGANKTTMERWLKELGLDKDFHFDHSNMISLAKAAEEVGVSRSMASLWFNEGLIPGARKVNATRVQVPASSIEEMKKLRKN